MDSEALPKNNSRFADYGWSLALCILFSFICLMTSDRVWHWFLAPVAVCGVLIGTDAIRWLKGRYNLFDPKGILGIMGFHFFFSAPLLAVAWGMRTKYTGSMLLDYRPWIGLIAFLNIFGLIIYRVLEPIFAKQKAKPYKKVWSLKEGSWSWVLFLFLAVAIAGQTYLFITHGFMGRVSYAESWDMIGGTGAYRLLGTAVPVLILIFITLLKNSGGLKRSHFFTVLFVLLFLLLISFVTGGLAGSRSATVWSLFWFAGIIHFYWRKISVKQTIVGILVLVLFMYVYGFYKRLGIEGLRLLQTEGFATASEESGTSVRGILIGDMSRADVHAYMAYALVKKPYSYEYRYGETIWGDLLVQFPVWIYRNEYNLAGSSGKMIAGTDLMMGPGYYKPYNQYRKSRYIYGLAGQAMLNFGIYAIPFFYVILAYCVGRFRRAFLSWHPSDMRFFLVPIIVNLLLNVLTSDFNNLVNFSIFRIAYPLVAIWFISSRVLYVENDEEGVVLGQEY